MKLVPLLFTKGASEGVNIQASDNRFRMRTKNYHSTIRYRKGKLSLMRS